MCKECKDYTGKIHIKKTNKQTKQNKSKQKKNKAKQKQDKKQKQKQKQIQNKTKALPQVSFACFSNSYQYLLIVFKK